MAVGVDSLGKRPTVIGGGPVSLRVADTRRASGGDAPPAAGTNVAGVNAAELPGAAPTPDPDVIRDEQGREYQRSVDPKTGETLWTHRGREKIEAGVYTIEIQVRNRRDGLGQRTVHERLQNGKDFRDIKTETLLDPRGRLLVEVADDRIRQAGNQQREVTRTEFRENQPVRRVQNAETTRTKTHPDGETETAHQKVDAVWDAGGKPLTKATKPTLKFEEKVEYKSPEGGLHKGYGRTVTVNRSAQGPQDRLEWKPMRLTVRFEGRKGSYLQRELEYKLDAQGRQVGQAKEISQDDQQLPEDKIALKTRMWGGLAGTISTSVGLRIMRAAGGRSIPGVLFMGLGGAAALAETTANAHALATQRADGSWPMMIFSTYDLAWQALLTSVVLRRPGLSNSALATIAQANIGAYGLYRAADAIPDAMDGEGDTGENPQFGEGSQRSREGGVAADAWREKKLPEQQRAFTGEPFSAPAPLALR